VVFAGGNDPVELGLVDSLNRPGGNLTGVTNLNIGLAPKRLQIIRELVPTTTAVAARINPTNPSGEAITQELQSTAHELGFALQVLQAAMMSKLMQPSRH
jgi:putative ABC transport system substrate-binding protein